MDKRICRKIQKICVISPLPGGPIRRLLPFLERILRTSGHPNNFPRKNRTNPRMQTLGMVRRHSDSNQRHKRQHKRELVKTLTKLENEGYRLLREKTEMFKRDIEWVGHIINQKWYQATVRQTRCNKKFQRA